MLVERFVGWSRTASVGDRVEAVRKLCEAYRFATVPENERCTTVAVLTAALDDPSPKVRRALAESLAPCPLAPRHLLLSLLRDVPSVSDPALEAVALEDADIVTFAAADEASALAVARRSSLTVEQARAVIENGGRDAVLAMLRNGAVVLSNAVLRLVAERFADDAAIRQELLASDIPASLRLLLRRSLADALARRVTERGLLGRVRAERIAVRDGEIATLELVDGLSAGETLELADDLLAEQRLTTALLLRAAATGRLVFVEAACARLAGAPLHRVASAFRSRRASSLKAMLLRGGIGAPLRDVLALCHLRWTDADRHRDADAQTGGRRVLQSVVREVAALPGLDAQTVCLLAEIETNVEREAAHEHADQILLAA